MLHDIREEPNMLQARRQFLKTSGMVLSAATLGSLLPQNGHAREISVGSAKAKHVIFLFMAGAPSQVDLFDHKPDLQERFREPLPPSISQGQRVTAMTKGRQQLVAPTMFGFKKRGKSGLWMSNLLPHLGEVADELCLIKSMHTNAINHDPGKTFICTGNELPGKASMGAWLSYGLGSMNRDLPDFVVLNSAYWTGGTRNTQALYSRLWGSGFLPSKHRGAALQTWGGLVLCRSNSTGRHQGGRGGRRSGERASPQAEGANSLSFPPAPKRSSMSSRVPFLDASSSRGILRSSLFCTTIAAVGSMRSAATRRC